MIMEGAATKCTGFQYVATSPDLHIYPQVIKLGNDKTTIYVYIFSYIHMFI